jgi:beta-galactosidase
VPDENPTGDYRRTFDMPASWVDAAAVVLRFDGVESRYRVWVNGSEIGVGTGSRLTAEFDVTDSVRPGENVIAVRVHQWSAGSYLEDQDQWWLPGIFRDVSLRARPSRGIDDLWLQAGYLDDGSGQVRPEIAAADDAFPITLRIADLGVEVRWAGPADVAPVAVGAVEPWTAETPRLYEATVSSKGETVSMSLGFRTVRIDGDRLTVNGRRVVFHGVNRHEIDADRGRVFDAGAARADLAMMKRFNVNAIRTSHYPPTPELLDLADELGLWVMVECDLETHGFEKGGWVGNPSDDPAWRDAYLARMRRTVEVHKNHPSVILWSLGNEAGTGANLAAMAAWVHARDPGRPVHYEGDYRGVYTDVYSRMYPTVAESASIGTDGDLTPLLGATVPESARQRAKPCLWCEYAHAMGNGPGALERYDEIIWRHPRIHGGFVWEWRDHGLRTRTADGTEFFGYGGDFGEVVHDGNFVMDGLVLPDSTPTPGLWEYKQVASPVRMTISRPGADSDALHVAVANRRHTADTSDLDFRFYVERDGEPVRDGILAAGPVAAGQEGVFVLPAEATAPVDTSADGEWWLTVEAVLREKTSWAAAGHSIGFTQFQVVKAASGRFPGSAAGTVRLGTSLRRSLGPGPRPGPGPRLGSRPRPASHRRLGPAEFTHGRLSRLAGRDVAGPSLQLFRGPTDNDRGASLGSYEHADPWAGGGRGLPAPPYADVWRAAGLDRLATRVLDVTEFDHGVVLFQRVSAANERFFVDVTEHWRLTGEELWLRVDVLPGAGWDMVWPRIGVRLDLPPSVGRADWFGTGPGESYPDSRRAARVGRFSASLDELTVAYSRPQETGHRSDLRSLTLHVAGTPWLVIDAMADTRGRRPGFTLTPYTAQQLDRAAHPHELVRGEASYLYLDAAQNGLGSRACGPDVWPEFLLRPEARTLTLRVRGAV